MQKVLFLILIFSPILIMANDVTDSELEDVLNKSHGKFFWLSNAVSLESDVSAICEFIFQEDAGVIILDVEQIISFLKDNDAVLGVEMLDTNGSGTYSAFTQDVEYTEIISISLDGTNFNKIIVEDVVKNVISDDTVHGNEIFTSNVISAWTDGENRAINGNSMAVPHVAGLTSVGQPALNFFAPHFKTKDRN